ncbi:MAG: endo-1,4-beta-xylanase [Treponema sp.]|nr:endo-1,4-beta-xylanase [Treponema sp.]
MKIKQVFSLLIIATLVFVFFGCEPPEEPIGDDIKLHTKWPFPLGVAVPGANTSNVGGGSSANNALLAANPQHRLLDHFNVVVAENEMKPSNLLPSIRPNITGNDFNNPVETDYDIWKAGYKWAAADELVDYAQANGKLVRGHTLFWHSQSPDWFFLNADNTLISTDQLYYRMDLHIRTVFEKYAGKIHSWDVVNEVIAQDKSRARPAVTSMGSRSGEQSYYTNIMDTDTSLTEWAKFDFVRHAFERARYWADQFNDTTVQFYITDFGVERPFPRGGTTKQQDFYDLIQWLVQQDAPVDGIGFQGHFRLYDHPVDNTKCFDTDCVPNGGISCTHNIKAGIQKFSEFQRTDGHKLKIIICELDFSIFNNRFSEGGTTMPAGVLNQRLNDLAQTYRDFFDMFLEFHQSGVIDMVLIWGLADGHSWLNAHPVASRTDYPLLFDRQYRPKAAYFSLVENR